MKRILMLLAGVCAMGGSVLSSGCGPGLVAAGGGSVGAIFGLGGDDEKKKDKKPPAPTTNVIPAVVVTSLTREESPATISYTILDANDDLCSVEVQFSPNGGAFQPCFAAAGGDGTTGLTSSASGSAHTFEWDFAADLGPALSQNVTVRIRATDATTTGSWAQLTNQSIGNDPPAFFNFAASGTDIILFSFMLGDQSSDLATLDVSYSIDQGQNFIPIDTDPQSGTYQLLGNPPTNLLATPGGSPGQFIWAAPLSLFDFVGDVRLRVVPKDQPSGYSDFTLGAPIVTDPFPVDTSVNGAPTLELLTSTDGLTFTGTVPLDITLQDDESNSAVVVVNYSIGGSAFAPATLVNQFSSGIAGPFITSTSPTAYSIVWDALADVGASGTFTNVVLALTPADGTVGTAKFSDAFTIIGNAAPEVFDLQALQDSGNIPIVIDMYDGQSDPVEITIEYSTDGVNYTPLNQSDFIFGDLTNLASTPFGESNVLIWDTTIAFAGVNAAGVTLRVTPTDHPPSATPVADLTGPVFVSASFPIINDPNGAVPISIDVFTTDVAGTPHGVSQVTVTNPGQKYLDNEINPATAVGFTTFWKIYETGADYGTLLDVGGGSLQYATGSISVNAPGGAGVNDGDTFVIDDGLNGPQTFEFDNNGSGTAGNVPVFIVGFSTADQVGAALADAINNNSFVRIDASHTGGGAISLTHTIACKLGDASSVSATGNAADMAFSGTAGSIGAQMSGGDGTKRVLYQAPATPPAGSQFVTLYCEIDDPAFFFTVRRGYTLWWGDAPTGVSVTPPTVSLLVGASQQFSASVTPAGAPQNVTWQVVGGNANGTINALTGLYTAPATPPVSNPVSIRATAVDGFTSGNASVTIQPVPTGVNVIPPANNPPTWVAPDLRLGASITFTSQVLPAAAPQGVNWRVIWNSQDWGSGNTTVGTINASGTYTAPTVLPSPDQVRIDAVSQAAATVFGSYVVDLVAPPPTSFDVTPSSASVFAGGAGQQFNVSNFQPANANTSVIWFVNPNVGSVSQSGFYTPPATLATQQVVTITARSAVASPTVEDTATVTVNPTSQVAPTGVDITPAEGITISTSSGVQPIQFSAVVSPGGASQTVQWTFFGTSFGSLGASTGLYTPAATSIDRFVRIRATAQVSPFPFDEVTVRITGDGLNWNEIGNLTLGRGQTSPVWDSLNERLWFVGGTSETSTTLHDEVPLYVDFSSGTGVGGYEAIGAGTAFPKTAHAIMCICDEDNDRLIALVCQGTADPVELYSLDLTKVDPPTVPPESWQKINYGGVSNAPKLGGVNRFHCWWDPYQKELQILVGNTTIYSYGTNTSGGGNNQWKTPETTQSQAVGPTDPLIVAHAYDVGNDEHFFVGASNGTAGAQNRVWEMDSSDWKWEQRSQSGTQPSGGLQNPAAYYHNGNIHLFSGRLASGSSYNSELYKIDVTSGSNAAWTRIVNTFERPLPRADGGFALAGFNGAILFGGESPGVGTFGDLWFFDESAGIFTPENATNIRPQGRRFTTGVFGNGAGITYGGICDHGVDNGLWSFVYSVGTGQPTWTRHQAGGTRPPALWGAASVWDATNTVMILYGGDTGLTGFSGINDKYWVYDPSTNAWTLLGTGPGKRREAAMCHDAVNERIWLFGGINDSGTRLNDLWYLNLSSGLPGNWVQIGAITGSPPDPRTGATIGYDSRANRLLVCGGNSTVSGGNSQLFSYAISSSFWTAVSITNTGSEEDVDGAAAIYDDEHTRIISTPSARKLTQAIVAATPGTTWQYMTPPPAANNSTGALGLYDQVTGRYYALFGERTILSRNIGSNNLRTFVVK
jgi:hypothetical protein